MNEPLSEYKEKETFDGTGKPSWLEYDGTRHFVKCRQCSATNILIMGEDESGAPVFTITRAIMEDE